MEELLNTVIFQVAEEQTEASLASVNIALRQFTESSLLYCSCFKRLAWLALKLTSAGAGSENTSRPCIQTGLRRWIPRRVPSNQQHLKVPLKQTCRDVFPPERTNHMIEGRDIVLGRVWIAGDRSNRRSSAEL